MLEKTATSIFRGNCAQDFTYSIHTLCKMYVFVGTDRLMFTVLSHRLQRKD